MCPRYGHLAILKNLFSDNLPAGEAYRDTSSRMRACSSEVQPVDTRVLGLGSEAEDVEE